MITPSSYTVVVSGEDSGVVDGVCCDRMQLGEDLDVVILGFVQGHALLITSCDVVMSVILKRIGVGGRLNLFLEFKIIFKHEG